MPLTPALLLLLAPAWQAAETPDLGLARVMEEAEVLHQLAPNVLSRETLVQRSLMPPSRFRPRAGSRLEQAMGQRLRIREVVSEYTFGSVRMDGTPKVLEFRQVLSVDGRPIQALETARKNLERFLQAPDERYRRRMLEEFAASSGLVDVATDYGLVLLAFTRKGLEDLEMAPLGEAYIGTDRARGYSWAQKSDKAGVVEFRGSETVRMSLRGTLWVRVSDGIPLRVSAWTAYVDGKGHQVRDEATVEYVLSPHGFMAPVSVVHRHSIDGAVQAENLYRYEPFRLFSSDSQIKFSDVPPMDGGTVKK